MIRFPPSLAGEGEGGASNIETVTPDVVVIGAGAIGTSIAYQLAKAGARVLILERGRVGSEATGASAGMIVAHHDRSAPEAFTTMSAESARLFPALAAELLSRTGLDIGYRQSGTLEIALDEAEAISLRTQRGWQVDRGMSVAWLNGAAALDAEPGLNPAVRAALLYVDDAQVMPAVMAQALARAAVDLGAELREGVAVDRLLVEGDRVVALEVGAETVPADEIVIANGAWASRWSAVLQTSIPVRPVRGQLLALQTAGTAVRHMVGSAAGYLLTKADGSTYVGATVEEVGFDRRPTASGIAGLLALAPRLVPRLADATFSRAWAGLRPGTPDGLPLIGRLPEWRGLTLAAGHFRNGILLAPITGVVVADLLAHRRPRVALEAFDPARFLVRAA